jgi:hypothetical protein
LRGSPLPADWTSAVAVYLSLTLFSSPAPRAQFAESLQHSCLLTRDCPTLFEFSTLLSQGAGEELEVREGRVGKHKPTGQSITEIFLGSGLPVFRMVWRKMQWGCHERHKNSLDTVQTRRTF